jgi:ferrochelatase
VSDAPLFGVLPINLGSPEAPTPRAVRSYLREFLADRRVIDLPPIRWWLIRHLLILPTRPRRSARLYEKIWTDAGSPLLVTTMSIGRGLEAELTARCGVPTPVAVGMRYGSPSIRSALAQLAERGCARVVVLPLYPQYSRTTTGSTEDAVAAAASASPIDLRSVTSYHEHPGYLAALEESVRERWNREGPAARLLMSFHGLPQRYADAGDPYPQHCAATAKALATRLELAPGRWHMAFQSRFGREPWLRPDLGDRLQRWGSRGVADVDVMCPGFAADCLETLEEVAMTDRRLFEAAGGRGFRYITALNERPEHIRALCDIVMSHAADWLDQKTSMR